MDRAPKTTMMELKDVILTLEVGYRSSRAAAEAYGIEPSYWHRLRSGALSNPQKETLEKLGIDRHVRYTWRAD